MGVFLGAGGTAPGAAAPGVDEAARPRLLSRVRTLEALAQRIHEIDHARVLGRRRCGDRLVPLALLLDQLTPSVLVAVAGHAPIELSPPLLRAPCGDRDH